MQCKGNNRKSKTNSGNRGLVLTGVRVETFNLTTTASKRFSLCLVCSQRCQKRFLLSTRYQEPCLFWRALGSSGTPCL